MVDFCSVDRAPARDRLRAARATSRAPARWRRRRSRSGCKALLIAVALPARATRRATSACSRSGRSRRRPGCRSCSTSAAAASCSIPNYFENGLPPVPDFHGGAENFRSVDYMAIPFPPMQTLATLIFDGVLERFPRLKFGVIEQGASWLPSWMRQLDSRARGLRAPRGAAAQALAAAERVRAPAGARDALPGRGRRLDHRAVRRGDLPVLVGLPARRGRPQSAQALRGQPGAARRSARSSASTTTTSST